MTVIFHIAVTVAAQYKYASRTYLYNMVSRSARENQMFVQIDRNIVLNIVNINVECFTDINMKAEILFLKPQNCFFFAQKGNKLHLEKHKPTIYDKI